MKKILTIVLSAAIVAVLGFSGYYFVANRNDNNTSQVTSIEETKPTQGSISFADDGRSLSYQGQEGIDVLTTLKSLTDVQTNSFDFGEFVTSINGVTADSSKEYWSLLINDKPSEVGAGAYIAKNGDVIKWQLENLQ